MGDFFAELRRRHIYRIGAVYVVVAWGITQVLDVLSQLFALPDWVAQPAVVVLAIGFPIILIAAWMIVGATNAPERSAEGLKATSTDWVIAGGLAVVIGLIGFQQLSSNTSETVATVEQENAATTITGEIVEQVTDRLPNSIAVLPFENVSPDLDDAYFAVGVHDELLNHLFKLRNLSVIARSSVLEYEDSTKSIPEIASELNVERVMQGSVRLANDQVRVGVQLFDGNENVPVWTETYDGDLSDIFGIQAEIAMNIANSLQTEFTVAELEGIANTQTDSPEAYEAYLRAVAEFRAGGPSLRRRTAVHAYLDEALRLDPNFAAANAWKAWLYTFSRERDAVTEENRIEVWAETDRLVETHADRALTLDRNLGLAHTALAFRHFVNWRIGLGLIELDEALRLSPNAPEVLSDTGFIAQFIRNEPEEAVRIFARAVELSPNNVEVHKRLARALIFAGRHREALEIYERYRSTFNAGDFILFAISEKALGDNEAALENLRLADDYMVASVGEQAASLPDGQSEDEALINPIAGILVYNRLAYGYGLLGEPEDADRAFARVMEIAESWHVQPSILANAYMGIGDYDTARAILNGMFETPVIQLPYELADLYFNIWFDPVLEQPEWVELRDKLAFRN